MTNQKAADQLLELELQLHEAELREKDARSHVSALRKKLNEAESDLLTAKLGRERLVEKLRVFHKTTVKYEPTAREEDIARFREVVSDLIDK